MNDHTKLSTSDIAGAGREPAHDHIHEAVDRPDVRHHDAPAPLFPPEMADGYRARWSAIQTGFVDEPRKTVEEADSLVAEVMKHLAEAFADERRQLESQWERAEQVSTEDLRQATRRYRSFFERLLSV
jgi:hypothetical protein